VGALRTRHSKHERRLRSEIVEVKFWAKSTRSVPVIVQEMLDRNSVPFGHPPTSQLPSSNLSPQKLSSRHLCSEFHQGSKADTLPLAFLTLVTVKESLGLMLYLMALGARTGNHFLHVRVQSLREALNSAHIITKR
jgi:hypothetical protein